MAVTAIPNTTLSAALARPSNTDQARQLSVASASGVSVGMMVVVNYEAMKVQEVDTTANTITVRRGSNGTEPWAQASGSRVYFATPESWQSLRSNAQGILGNSGTLPQWLIPGQHAFDGAGNEYVLVDLTFSAFKGVAILISPDGLFTGSALFVGGVGSVGIIAEEATSNQFAWVQIYGAFPAAQFTSGSSLATSTGIIEPATTASVPTGALLGRTTSQASSAVFARVLGMKLTSAITTGTTAATSATGFVGSVWLNYPYMDNDITSA